MGQARWVRFGSVLLLWVLLTVLLGAAAEYGAYSAGADARWSDTFLPGALYSGLWIGIAWPMRALARRIPLPADARWYRLVWGAAARLAVAIVGAAVHLHIYFLLSELLIGAFVRASGWEEGSGVFLLGRAYEGVAIAVALLSADALRAYAFAERTAAIREARMHAQLAEARLRALGMELQPHFLFNSLNAISALVHTDPTVADRMIVRLSTLLRRTLDDSGQPTGTIEEELELLELYLDIQRIRFGDRLTVQIDIDPEALDARVPRMLLQPIVENAMEHGLEPARGAVTLQIGARRVHDRLCCTVADDGVGLAVVSAADDSTSHAQGRHAGVGLRNVRARLQEMFGDDHAMTLEPGASGGTVVTITMPHVVHDRWVTDRTLLARTAELAS